ncbi:PREDICTED: uncharacterized protein LOC105313471 [Amphimedon queenslandica]|nr:PREDICTED: uncharacterized protein LOC105313471 [Amphimedon queenslandica]|eukprot:XP_019854499.1 PREDICTED: uncharacterized protein LOC105313471 [Amphimedon queenslandica]
MLVISGGLNKNNDKLDDCWIFNITQDSWIKLNVPHSVSKKNGHSLSVFIMSPHCVWIVTGGGFVDKSYKFVTHPNIAMLTELVLSSKGKWTVGDTLDTNGMNNEEYKKKYQQQLQRRRKGDTANIEQTIQALIQSLEEKEKKLQEKEREAQVCCQQLEQKEREVTEKDQEIRRYCHHLQEKDREEAEREQRYHNQLQEKEKEEAKKEKRHHQQLLHEKVRIEALKNEEIQQYCYQLQKKEQEMQKYIYQLQEKEKKEVQQDQIIQRCYQQLQEKAEKEKEMQKYCEKLKKEAEKEKRHCQQLQEKEAIKEKEIQRYHQELREKLAEKEEKIQMYHYQLQEKEREVQEKQRVFFQQLEQKEREEAEKNQEIRRYCHQEEKEERYHNQLQEKDSELQEKDRELQKKERELQKKDRELQEKAREEAEREQRYHNKLQQKEKEEAEKEKWHHQQFLQEKVRIEALKNEEIHQLQEKVNLLQEKEKEKAEIEKKYYWQLKENERKDEEIQRYTQLLQEKEQKYDQHFQEKAKEIQHYCYQLLGKEQEMQKYIHQLKEKERKETQQDEAIQRYCQQLQAKDQEIQKYCEKLKEEAEKEKRHQEKEAVKEKEIQKYCQELREKEKKEAEKEHQLIEEQRLKDKYFQQLQEKEKELAEKKQMIQMYCQQLQEKERHVLYVDELKGVHVAAKNSYLIHGESTQSVKWEEYGIRITIPQGAVLPSDTVKITIAALVGGDFIFPEDTELVSAVYAISLSKPFLEPVKLEIQHCVSIETSSHCNYLSFSTSTNNQPPYQFNTVDGGEFFIGNRYGSISIATFSKYCIKTYSGRRYRPYSIPGTSSSRARSRTLSSSLSSPFDGPCSTSSPVSPLSLHSSSSSFSFDLPNTLLTKNEIATQADKPPIKCYHSQVMYEIKRPGREWLMRFLVSKDLNALIEYIRKAFRNVEKSIEVSFQFKDDDGFIELCFDDEKCPKGWSVRPHQDPTRVRQIVIDKYGSMSPPRFPECLITITATPGEGAVKELSYPVTLQGIKKSNFEKMNIVLTMGDTQLASAGTIASNTGPISLDDEERKSAGEVLRENFDTLSDILAAPNNLSAIIINLYAKKLISDTTATECMNDGRPVHDRCALLLFALKATIDGKPQAMISLIEVLKNNEAFKEIADKIDLEVSYRNYTNP